MKTHPTQIESYSPEFVLRLHDSLQDCQCDSCQQVSPLVTLNWANEIRHSARMECDSVAAEILLKPDAFVLHTADVAPAPDAAPALSQWHSTVNQCCINLLITDGISTAIKLYAIGIFLSHAQKMHAEQQPVDALTDTLHQLMALAQQGILQEQFTQLPPIDNYKLAQLRQLSEVPIDAALDPLTAMALVLKLNELKILSDNYLAESLQEIATDNSLATFADQHPSLWINHYLYCCYHDTFPAGDPQNYGQAFLTLCEDYFSLNALCNLLAQSDCPPDEQSVSALFAAWRRTAPQREGATERSGTDPLLQGLSLLS